jgi:hypothetical protein
MRLLMLSVLEQRASHWSKSYDEQPAAVNSDLEVRDYLDGSAQLIFSLWGKLPCWENLAMGSPDAELYFSALEQPISCARCKQVSCAIFGIDNDNAFSW